MGCDSMDKAPQVDRTGLLRSRKEKFWTTHVLSYFHKYYDRDIEGYCPSI